MASKNERGRRRLCLGALGAFLVAGAVTLSGRPDAAAQQPQRTPLQIFTRACGRCHADPEEPDARLDNKNIPESEMVRQIRQGTKRMRAIPPARLPDADMPALLTYLRSIRAVR